jgi:hypothetical protein
MKRAKLAKQHEEYELSLHPNGPFRAVPCLGPVINERRAVNPEPKSSARIRADIEYMIPLCLGPRDSAPPRQEGIGRHGVGRWLGGVSAVGPTEVQRAFHVGPQQRRFRTARQFRASRPNSRRLPQPLAQAQSGCCPLPKPGKESQHARGRLQSPDPKRRFGTWQPRRRGW